MVSTQRFILFRLLITTLTLAIVYYFSISHVFADTTSVLLPTSDGNYTQWIPNSGSSHYTRVDETVCNGNTDFNYRGNTPTGQRDSYAVSLSSIPNGSTITNISITPCASKRSSSSGSSTMNLFYRWNAVNSSDAGGYVFSSGTTPAVQSATDFSSLTHVKSASSSLELGAVYTSGNRGLKLSQISTIITYTPLAAPTSLAATAASQTQINLSWIDNATNEDGYNIERSPNGSSDWTQIATTSANATSYPNTGLTANTTYYYRVYAYNLGGNSSNSNTANATTLPNAPSVTTDSVTNITTNSAMLNATINPNSGSTDRYYRYGTSNISCASLPSTTSTVNIGSGVTDVSPNAQSVSGLSSVTTYYYCAVGTNSGGTTYGSVLSFKTYGLPTVTTDTATNVNITNVTFNSTVNPNGLGTSVFYRYGTANASCSALPFSQGAGYIGSGTSDVSPNSLTVNSLNPSTTYYYCAGANNSNGYSYGNVFSFTTTAATTPTVTTNSAINITQTTASLAATMNPKGASSDGYFKYDTVNNTCENLANSTTSSWLGSFNVDYPIYKPVTSLSANTTYYYCGVVTNSLGTTYGSVLNFTTLP